MTTHRQTMIDDYRLQSGVYDATRWTFLYGRSGMIERLAIEPGERVLEIGCGTGRNFETIQQGLQGAGELTGVDCSASMLREASQRIRSNGWKNVLLIDHEYGRETITEARADAVILSYSLSMIPDWETALACAAAELRPGGRIGIVDFCKPPSRSQSVADGRAINHVHAGQPYEDRLQKRFQRNVRGSLPAAPAFL